MHNPFRDLTRGERCLWLCSVAVVALSFALSGGDWLSGAASLIGVTALIFVAKGYVLGQVLTVVFAVCSAVFMVFCAVFTEPFVVLTVALPVDLAVCFTVFFPRSTVLTVLSAEWDTRCPVRWAAFFCICFSACFCACCFAACWGVLGSDEVFFFC